MTEQQNGFSFKSMIFGILCFSVLLQSCGGSGGNQDYIEETLEEPTQGIIVELQETKKDLFKITNEEILGKREDSRIIAQYLDNSRDTFTIDEVKLTSANNPQRSLLRTAAYAGLMGYYMGRPMSSGIRRSAYANDNAYSKSSSSNSAKLKSTAKRTTVRKPSSSSSYGKKKSTRSYGG